MISTQGLRPGYSISYKGDDRVQHTFRNGWIVDSTKGYLNTDLYYCIQPDDVCFVLSDRTVCPSNKNHLVIFLLVRGRIIAYIEHKLSGVGQDWFLCGE